MDLSYLKNRDIFCMIEEKKWKFTENENMASCSSETSAYSNLIYSFVFCISNLYVVYRFENSYLFLMAKHF